MQPNTNEPTQPSVQQPQPAPQPVPTEPTQTPKKKHTVLWVVLSIIAVLIIGGGIAAYFLLKDSDKETTQYMNAIIDGNYDTAYGYFSDELRNVQDDAEFERGIKSLQLDEGCTYKTSSKQVAASTNAGETRTATGKITCGDRVYLTETSFTKIGDGYKLTLYSIKPQS